MQHSLPDTQRINFARILEKDLRTEQDREGVSPDAAFLRVGLRTLGFDPDEGYITDGPLDCGFDFINVTQEEASVFQAKSVIFQGGVPLNDKFDATYLGDLRRIISVIQNLENLPEEANKKVTSALTSMRNEVNRRALALNPQTEDIIPILDNELSLQVTSVSQNATPIYKISIYFLGLAHSFTSQAQAEFDSLTNVPLIMSGRVKIEVSIIPVFIDDLLSEKWQQRNTDWKDREGKKREEIHLSVVGEAIVESKSAVFFTRAYDLVQAYEDYGYQIFEPNVRCELKESKVNQAIKRTITTREGRREFRHLNNGITLVCTGYTGKQRDRKIISFAARRPGVVNGLQTVKSLHDAFRRLPQEDQIDFKENCLILCRLHQEGSVSRLEQLVKATNNQNPMKARNLKSNDPEQAAYETIFANLNWFYERKQGAWDAFKSDPRGWRGLSGKRPEAFQISNSRLFRVVDNDDIAQSWLAFIGFSTEAINDKRTLFDQDNHYNLIFLRKTARHGFDYEFKLTLDSDVHKDSAVGSPSAHLLLAASLCRQAADLFAVGRRENRDNSIIRLQLVGKNRDEQDRALEGDDGYQINKLIRGMLTLFVEFIGFIMFRSLQDNVHSFGGNLLENGSFASLVENLDGQEMIRRHAESDYAKNDLLPILFASFEHCVKQLYESNWLRSYNDAVVKNKFIYSPRTRKQLLNELLELDKRFSRGEVVRSWADGFNEAKGVFSHVRNVLLKPTNKSIAYTNRFSS